jgi:methionine biosynthesis protein MetW
MSTKDFENWRWENKDQKPVFRHRAAADLIKSGSVLDLGCGDGLFLEVLRQKGFAAEGLDLAEEGIKKCLSKGLCCRVFDFAEQKLPFASGQFDQVVMLDVLEHLYFPDWLLQEAARVSRWFVIISVPNFSSGPARLQMLAGRVPENNRPQKGHVFWFNHRVLKRLLREAKLNLVELRANTFWENRPILGRLSRRLARWWPGLFALSFVVKAEKIK